MKKSTILISMIVLSFFVFIGCAGDPTLTVKLTDAPYTDDQGKVVEEVNVVITRVDVVKKGSGESNSSQVKSGDGVSTVLDTETALNLLDYQDGATKLLGSVELEEGDYLQLRFIVCSLYTKLQYIRYQDKRKWK